MVRDLCGERGMRSLRRGLESGVTVFVAMPKLDYLRALSSIFAPKQA
jgi:hypothetical protein